VALFNDTIVALFNEAIIAALNANFTTFKPMHSNLTVQAMMNVKMPSKCLAFHLL